MSKIILSLGSNMGNKHETLNKAIVMLKEKTDILRVSPIFETPPWGNTDQDSFYNMCAEIEFGGTPHALLDFIHQIEADLGRKRELHWGPRTLDIDIILIDGIEIKDNNLTIPHKYWMQRAFVIAPMMSLFPSLNAYGYNFTSAVYVLKDEIMEILSHQIN